VLPAHNEEAYLSEAVREVVLALRQRHLDFEVIIVENGSTDGTQAEAEGAADAYPEVRAVRSPEADYGIALKTGFLAAGGDLVVNFDVDFVDMDFLDRAVAMMDASDLAIVVGSKRGEGADDQRAAGRKVITAVFTGLLRFGFGMRVSDTHGVKAMRRVPLVPLVAQCQFGRDIFDTELILRAERAGMHLGEIPVSVVEKRPARSSIVRRIPRTIAGLARLRVALWRSG
jgi:glycosyltransferase involved in cell wall biosynthesis